MGLKEVDIKSGEDVLAVWRNLPWVVEARKTAMTDIAKRNAAMNLDCIFKY